MMNCIKHDYFYYGSKCEKCLNNIPAKLRDKNEISPDDIKLFRRRRWIK